MSAIDGVRLISLHNPSLPISAKSLSCGLYQYKILFDDGSEATGKWAKLVD